MKKRTTNSKGRQVLGRQRFERISAVEGVRLTDEMKRAFAGFDRRGLSASERRRAIISRFKDRTG